MAWMKLRAGVPTASCFDRIMTPAKKASASREDYLNLLLAERILNRPLDTFQSEDMARGNEFESKAVASYEFQHECDTIAVGFVTNFDGKVGCSPDRFILQHLEGALECKCPKAQTHIGYLLASTGAGKKYKVQLQGQIWVCERDWVDILSYHPEMPEALYRVHRDDEFIKELAAHVLAFAGELEEKAGDFAERGWIKTLTEIEQESQAGFLSQEDINWAMARYTEGE